MRAMGGADTQQAIGEAFRLELKTSYGTLRGVLRVPPNPMRLSELAFNFMGLSDQLVDLAVRREASEGRTVSCKKGCGACCRQVVPLSPPEAWMVADLVAGMGVERQRDVRTAFSSVAGRLSDTGLRAALTGTITSVHQLTAIAADYFRLGLPCPFLSDEACSVHPYRPSVCREYLVTSSATHCATLTASAIARVPVAARLSEALVELTAELLGTQREVVPLALALEWAANHEREGQRRWGARQLVEGLVRKLREIGNPTEKPSESASGALQR
jgi:Fe-S-cluster containining protein